MQLLASRVMEVLPVLEGEALDPAFWEEGEPELPFSVLQVPLWQGVAEEEPVWVLPLRVAALLAGPWVCRDRFFPGYAVLPLVRDEVRGPVPLLLPAEAAEAAGVELLWAPPWVLPARGEGAWRGEVLLAWKARKRLELL